MSLHEILKKTEKLITDNSPTILTAIAVTGTITTAYLTGKSTFKAAAVLEDDRTDREVAPWVNGAPVPGPDLKGKVKMVWKFYIPPVITGTLTCAAIVGVNKIGTRRTAAMAAAFSLSERAFDEYKEKVVQQIGQNKEQKVRDEIATDRLKKNPPVDGQIIMTKGGDVLFMDAYSGRYFQSDMESVKKAQNDTNHEVLNHGYASLTDLYSRLGLSSTKISDDVGWNSDKLLEMTFTSALTEELRPCVVMDFTVAPMRDFFRTH